MSSLSKAEVIASLGLGGHFEGGYFRETFRPTHREKLETARGRRGTMTSIYYMLTDDSPVDHFHTKHSDGIQFHHFGAPLTYHMIHPDGRYEAVVLGPDLAAGQVPSLAVAGGVWKAAELPAGEYGLVSEVVAPGWEMEDMILVSRAELLARFPQHAQVITRLTPAP
ncbi:purine nucleoside permease [Devosia insulae DS-56]|uniref:Purine nucleoside permease n=1 Tax=Devosia insulae DS-56 TaxID=1116389 RepID=A0A1E5XNX1_9HYPH|nr:cupin domain-containing protein [Devosia insulae]OEO30302.1 purine nucleoside permease [Devosia insulae DS-56]